MTRAARARGSRLGRSLLAAVAAVAGAGAAISLSAGAAAQPAPAESPVVQMWSVPAALAPSGPGAITDSALAPAADGAGEEVIVSSPSGGARAVEVSPLGQLGASSVGQLGSGPFAAMVEADGLDWALAADGLYAIGGPGSAAQRFAAPNGSFTDMAVGLDGHLYLADNNGNVDRCEISSSPSAGCDSYPIASGFSAPQPEAIAAAGPELWFTTAAQELGWVSSAGARGGPYGDVYDYNGNLLGPASALSHSLALGANGYLFAIGSPTDPHTGVTALDSTIAEIDPRVGPRIATTGDVVNTYNLGLPAGTTLSSLASGPDGDLWFTEETTSGPNAIGQLDPTTGTVTSYPLPSGYVLQGAGADAIEPGPVGSYTIWFAAQRSGSPSEPAIGEIADVGATTPGTGTSVPDTTSTPTPTTTASPTTVPATSAPATTAPATTTARTPSARLSVASIAKVSGRGVASVPLRCAGASGQTCTGTLALTIVVSRTVTVEAKGRRRTKRQRVTLTLGSARYRVRATRSAALAVKLSASGVARLAAARGHRLGVTARVKPAAGAKTSASLTLMGPPNLRR